MDRRHVVLSLSVYGRASWWLASDCAVGADAFVGGCEEDACEVAIRGLMASRCSATFCRSLIRAWEVVF